MLFSSLPQLLQIYMEPILLSQMLTFTTIQVTDNIPKLIKRDVFEERYGERVPSVAVQLFILFMSARCWAEILFTCSTIKQLCFTSLYLRINVIYSCVTEL